MLILYVSCFAHSRHSEYLPSRMKEKLVKSSGLSEESSSPRVLVDMVKELNGSRHEIFRQPIGLCGMRMVSTLLTLGGGGSSSVKECQIQMSCPQSRP